MHCSRSIGRPPGVISDCAGAALHLCVATQHVWRRAGSPAATKGFHALRRASGSWSVSLNLLKLKKHFAEWKGWREFHIVKCDFAMQMFLRRTSCTHIIRSLVAAGEQPPHVSSTLLLRWIKPEPVVRAFFRLLSSFCRSSSGSRRAALFLLAISSCAPDTRRHR